MRAGRAVALAALLLTAAEARAVELAGGAKPVTLDVTETLLFDVHAELEEQPLVLDLRNRLNLRLRWDRLTVGLRLDAAAFDNAPRQPDGSSQFQDDLRVEDVYVKYRHRRLVLTLGDDYLALGRGMALSLRKIDELGFDVNLRGAHLQWANRWLKLRASAGLTNVTNVDGVSEKLVPDPMDGVFALRVGARPLKGLSIGAQAVDIERRHSPVIEGLAPIIPYSSLEDSAPQRAVRTWIAGGNVGLQQLADKVDLYFEGNVQQSTSERNTARGVATDTTDGLALYAEITGYFEALTLLLEAKHYDGWAIRSTPHPLTSQQQDITQTFAYVVPPSLERYDQRVVNNTDVTGVHARGDYRLPTDGDNVFLSAALFVDAPVEREWTLHTYAGWEHKGRDRTERWVVQAGYRQEERPGDDAGPSLTRLRMVHVDLDLHLLLSGPHDLQWHWSHEFRTTNPGTDLADDYVEGTTYVGWNWAPHWSFTAQFEYLTDRASGADWAYPGLNVMYRFDQSSFLRLFGGRSKGGLKCSGGVCRVFPEFSGVKLEATVRF